ARMLEDPYFAQRPPKSTGRDRFNLDWLAQASSGLGACAPADVQASLVALTCESIARAVRESAPRAARVVACGGGVRNAFLMERLAAALAPLPLQSTAAYGVPPDFVEAIGFAWLARETLEGRPGNLPAVTGARGARVLGGIYPA
ncbi:MAG TPA: anhydro-N-acetylmuramic acid kinase, partial [Candidatus Saccharimonadia bacterium]|nr:anhydro-N-acetylmuramic acid kinase [Candidatus Saccharimonadia bacterium]